MKKRMAVVCGLILVAATNATDASAQQFPGTSSMLTSPTTLTLMRTLGYAPTDYCGFYFYLSTSYQGRFSPDLLKALLPMCANWPVQQPPSDPGSGGEENSGGGTTDPGTTGGSTGSGTTGGSTDPGTTGGGSTDPGTTGGGSTDPGYTGGLGGEDGFGGNGGDDGWTDDGNGDEDPFGGGTMATPEPISLILLGTGLAGIGGARASRRRRRPEAED